MYIHRRDGVDRRGRNQHQRRLKPRLTAVVVTMKDKSTLTVSVQKRPRFWYKNIHGSGTKASTVLFQNIRGDGTKISA